MTNKREMRAAIYNYFGSPRLFLTRDEAAEIMGFSKTKIDELCAEKKLVKRSGKIMTESVIQYADC